MPIFDCYRETCRLGVLLTLMVGVLLAGLVPVSPARADDEAETVTFVAQGLPTPERSDVVAIAARHVLRRFQERYPQYEIRPFTMPTVEGAAMDAGPLMAIAAGVPPHAIYVNFRQSSTYIAQGFLTPLEVLLARELSDDPQVRAIDDKGQWVKDPSPQDVQKAIEAIRERTPDPAWPVVYREDESGTLPGKHVWAIPTGPVVVALFYRRDLFAQAGLDPDRPPQNWSELLEYARRLTDPARRQYGILFNEGIAISWRVYNLLVANGATVVEQDEEGNWHATFDSREAAEALYFLWRIINEPFERDGQVFQSAAIQTGGGDASMRWRRGEIAMQSDYLDEEMMADINPQLVGIAPMPASHRGTRGSEFNSRMMGVFSDATPQQQLAAIRYIWYLTSDEAKRIRTETYIAHGFGQFVSPDLLEKFGYDRLLERVPPGWREAYEVAVNHGVPEPYGRNTQTIYRQLSRPINRVLRLDLHNVERDAAISRVQQVLAEAAREVDIKVLGHIPEEELQKRRVIAWIVIVLVIGAFGTALVHIWRYFSHASQAYHAHRNPSRFIWGYALLAPSFLLILLWQYIPLAGGVAIAFMDYRIVLDSVFVGVDNFAAVLFDDRFWTSLGRTLYFVALMIGLGFWPPILLAILLQEIPGALAKYIFRTIFYLPAVVAGVVVMFLWKQLYDPSEYGVLNQLLMSVNRLDPFSATLLKWVLLSLWLSLVGLLAWLPVKIDEMSPPLKATLWGIAAVFAGLTLWPVLAPLLGYGDATGLTASAEVVGRLFGRFHVEPLGWTSSPRLAMLCVVIPTIWAASGPGCIIYLAALKTVPEELYEAAEIDGASHWHKVFYIVLPRLKYLIVIQFIAAVISAFRGGVDLILALTGGGPEEATNILSLEIFYRTFLDLRFGIGTTMAWMMGVMLIGFTAYQLKLLSKAEFKAAG